MVLSPIRSNVITVDLLASTELLWFEDWALDPDFSSHVAIFGVTPATSIVQWMADLIEEGHPVPTKRWPKCYKNSRTCTAGVWVRIQTNIEG